MAQIKRKWIENAAIDETKLASSVAGNGLSGGAGSALAVNAGDGIQIISDNVAAKVSDIAGAGLEDDGSNNLRLASTVAGDGLALAAGVLSVNVDSSTIEINLDSLRVKAAGITESHLAASVAGNGLTGGAGTALAVNTGDGLEIVTDAVKAKVSDFAGAGLEDDGANNLRLAATVAGNGLAHAAGVLSVNTGDGMQIVSDAVAVDGTVIRSSGAVAFAADQSMGGFKLTNLAAPVSANDATRKAYVDGLVNGLKWKEPVRAIATSNITLSGTQTVDGVSLIAGDRLLVAGQTTASENGIYVVAAGAFSRSTDADESSEIKNMTMLVSEGTSYADTQWTCTTDGTITLGTTSLAFAQISGAGSINAGNGLTKSGSTLDVVAGDTSLTVAADSVAVNLASGSGLAISSGVKINLEASNPSLQISSNELGIKFDGAGALSKGASGTKANVDGTSIEISSNALRIASGAAGSGLGYSAGVLSVNAGDGIQISTDNVAIKYESTALKINGSAQLEAAKPAKESFTLIAGDITNGYVDLAQVVMANSLRIFPVGGPEQSEVIDYTVSLTGGAGGKTRITFAGDLLSLVAGDILKISYMYL